MTRVKRLICFCLILVLLAGPVALAYPGATCEYEGAKDLIYLEAMLVAAQEGTPEAFARGAEAETAWNQQIRDLALNARETAFFGVYYTSAEVAVKIAAYLVTLGITEINGNPIQYRIVASSLNLRVGPDRNYDRIGSFPHGAVVTFLGQSENGWKTVTNGTLVGWVSAIHLAPFDGTPTPNWGDSVPGQGGGGAIAVEVVPPMDHTQDDLFWLALAIELEAGSAWLCDEHQLFVGNVVLNRVAHPRFPGTTIHAILHQPGQYPWAALGVRVPISDRAWANAERLLNGERFLPYNVVFQAQFFQGDGTYRYIAPHYFGYLITR
ncbi:MAG: cell wall hydrolase [Oscillospiraceae bacterium]|nr:cell wall hydrolase [Oscillospiraceae bacterium]